MSDSQKYPQGVNWYFFLDAILAAAVVVPLALMLLLM